MPTFTLRLTGNATITTLAEQANLRIAISSQGPNKQAVSKEVLTTARYIEDMIGRVQAQDAASSPLSHWSQTTLSMSNWIEHVPLHLARDQDIVGEIPKENTSSSVFGNSPLGLDRVPVRRYRGRIEFEVRFRDLAILSEFSTHLTSVDHCEISGPEWNLPPNAEERVKSQLRTKAAQDASSKVVDYCRVVCPGQDDIVIVPTELGSEHITGGSVPAPSRLDQSQGMLFSTGKPDRLPSSQNTLGTGKPGLLLSSTPAYSTDLGCTPQEISMTMSVDFVFTVETNGFRLSSTSEHRHTGREPSI